MSLVFVDADILIRSEDGADPLKRQAAMAWLGLLWQRRLGRTSQDALSEFYLVATRRLAPPMPPGDARAEVRRYELWQPWLTDHATVESAWAVESRHGLDFRDSLVVAAAQHLGCSYLLSEGMAHGQQYGGVQIVNPFKAGIELLEPQP